MPLKDIEHLLQNHYPHSFSESNNPKCNENTPFIKPIIPLTYNEGNDSKRESDKSEQAEEERLDIDDLCTIIKDDELRQLQEMLYELATATIVHDDIVQILRSIQDELRAAESKTKELTECVKSYENYLKLKYNE